MANQKWRVVPPSPEKSRINVTVRWLRWTAWLMLAWPADIFLNWGFALNARATRILREDEPDERNRPLARTRIFADENWLM